MIPPLPSLEHGERVLRSEMMTYLGQITPLTKNDKRKVRELKHVLDFLSDVRTLWKLNRK